MDLTENSKKQYRVFPSVRFLVFILVFVGCIVRQAGNNVLNFTIACMVNSSFYLDAQTGENVTKLNATSSSSCSVGTGGVIHDGFSGSYNWDRTTQSNLLAALNWGSMIFIFAGGIMCDRFGVKKLFVILVGLLALTGFLIPVVSAQSWIGIFVLRVMQGLSMVVGWPVVMAVSNVWFPSKEVGIMQSVATSGSQIGAFLVMTISGEFCKSGMWQDVYYLLGSLTIVTALGWLFFYSEKVVDSPFISDAEKDYIVSNRRLPDPGAGPIGIPWKSFLTSVPLWAIVLSNFCNPYIFFFVAQFSATYYKEVIGIDPSSSGLYTALPFAAQLVGRNIAGFSIGWAEGRIPLTVFMKISGAIAAFLPPTCLMISTLFDCHHSGAVVALFILSYFFYGWIIAGYVLSTQSIAPQFAATIAGFSQTAMFASGIVCPYVTGALTKNSTPEEWKIAIYIACGLSYLGGLIFLIFGSGKRQPWADLPVGQKVEPRVSVIRLETDGKQEARPRRRSSIFISDAAQFACERNRLPSLTDAI